MNKSTVVPTDRPVHRSQLRVRYAETDRMGVAYYANYLIWFEVARTDFLREHGLRYRDLEARGHLLPVGTVDMRLVAPARYDDALHVDVWLEEARSRTITFAYIIGRNEETGRNTVIATGCTTLVAADEQLKPSALPADIRLRFRDLCGGES